MPDKINLLYFFAFVLIINSIFSFKYPINRRLIDAELGEITSVEISNKADFDKYIITNDFVISIFHADWCGHCQRFLPVFDEASRYKIINNKWKFLKISCTKNEILCNLFSINGYPTIKTFKESKEIQKRPPRELDSFLEYLLKISNSPFVEIENNNYSKFFNDYGTFSPLIEYNSKKKNFINCVNNLANKEFFTEYYFGLIKRDEEKVEKITFDFDNNPLIYVWNENCEDAKVFLNNNIFPLVSNMDISFMRKMNKYEKTIFMLFYNSNNNKMNNFLKNEYKNISKENRNLVFGYVKCNQDKDISNYFKIKLSKESEIQIVIYNFDKEISYKHAINYDLNSVKEEEIESHIRELLKNINNLPFTSGSKFKDFLRKIGLMDMSPTTTIILVVVVFGILISLLCFLIFFCDSENNYEDLDTEEEKLLKQIKKKEEEKSKSNVNTEKKEKKNLNEKPKKD